MIFIGDLLIDPTHGVVTVEDVTGSQVVLSDFQGMRYTRSIHYVESYEKLKQKPIIDISPTTAVVVILITAVITLWSIS